MAKKKILIVEDEKDLRTLVSERLKDAGYDVHEAADGKEGLELAEKIHPDIVVSDVVMPNMDGNQFFKELRKTDFGKNIPFIILTARAKMRDYFEVVDVDGFMDKPFKTRDLIEKIEDVLSGKKTKGKPKPKKQEKPEDQPEIVISPEMGAVVKAEMIDTGTQPTGPAREPPKKQDDKPKTEKAVIKKKILIVDDSEIVYRELQKTLSKHDCETKVVATPAKCLRELSRFFPDIIMSKFVLAEMNADTMANIIKEMPRFKDTPIIIYGDIGQEVDDDESPDDDTKKFVLNSEGYDVLRKVTELLKKGK